MLNLSLQWTKSEDLDNIQRESPSARRQKAEGFYEYCLYSKLFQLDSYFRPAGLEFFFLSNN